MYVCVTTIVKIRAYTACILYTNDEYDTDIYVYAAVYDTLN
jgi:hypothetical protein